MYRNKCTLNMSSKNYLLLIIIKNYFKGRYYYPMPSSSLTHNFY